MQKIRSKWLKWSLWGIAGLVLAFALFYWSVYFGLWGHIPTQKELGEIVQNEASEVYGLEDKLIGKYYLFDRQSIPYDAIPQNLIDALIATEDFRFYDHNGIDYRSFFRVFFKSILLMDDSSGGGSTVTQQLAKNLYKRKNYGRLGIAVNKLREMIIAKRIEKVYSKEEILTFYLNTVPFSDNTYGIESASYKFFNKRAKRLKVEEAAVLVGMLKANYYYNPRLFPEKSMQRRNTVLHQMVKYDYLGEEAYDSLKTLPVKLQYTAYSHDEGIAPYFREQVKKEVEAWCAANPGENGETYDIYRDGLRIYTTLDARMQSLAEEAMQEHLGKLQEQFEKSYGKRAPWIANANMTEEAVKRSEPYLSLKQKGWKAEKIMDSLRKPRKIELFEWGENKIVDASTVDSIQHYLKFLNTGMIGIDPHTGAVRTWIGGINYKYFKYDHVRQSKRQVGSTFKPIVYTTAIENGLYPCSYFSPKKVVYEEYDGWSPSNATEKEEDEFVKYSLKYALSRSINTVAVKVLDFAGIGNTIAMAKKMGIDSPLPEVPSLALGTAGISVEEMAGAYAAYINNSRPVKPFFITRIEDKEGNVLAEFRPEERAEPAFSEHTRQVILEMMKATVNEGTASRIRYAYKLNNAIAGKTGTTQSNKDGWFVGVTPNLVTVTWVGADDHRIGFRSTRMGQGANSALPVFAGFMQKMNKDSVFDPYTKARFKAASAVVRFELDCEPVIESTFLERLFGNTDNMRKKERRAERKEKRKEKKKKKKGFFKWLFGKKDKN
ncbi:transglycosylase domain-containing protein [Sinomicrobium kalidii]|uniref:transglycosylase domain-containing protein n=1 Tax=Sinomicrobium kalidii TaxID=2900738 RepID=UPI001E436C35|nr:transglycosylase domain-containing protein [Sinomicrobium kalidii]UGU16900.1 transglycosylase domain-containing protein [Sinomicrobium kalidii]